MGTVGTENVGTALREFGIAAVSDILSDEDCRLLLGEIAWCRANPGPLHRRLSPVGEPFVDSDLFRWRDNAAVSALVAGPALVNLAKCALDVDQVVLLEDQWFWSQEGSSTPSPWHQDEPYHPLDHPFVTIWLPLTAVPEGLGLRGVVGSHLGDIYAPVEFSSDDATLGSPAEAAVLGHFSLQPVPDVDADAQHFPVFAPAAGPGDAVLLDSRTLHAAGGSCGSDFVRLSIRYAHPQTRFTPRPWPVATFWDQHAWAPGERLASPSFPLLS